MALVTFKRCGTNLVCYVNPEKVLFIQEEQRPEGAATRIYFDDDFYILVAEDVGAVGAAMMTQMS